MADNVLITGYTFLRNMLHYIRGDSRLWYIKKDILTNKHIINRNSLTLIFAVMHWMSELVRYNPEKFAGMPVLMKDSIMNLLK